MWHDYSTARNGGVSGGGLSLDSIWHVRADDTYSVTRNLPPSRQLIIIRTLGGRGTVTLDTDDMAEVSKGTLFIVNNEELRQYRQKEGTWHFWWFVCESSGPLFFPLRQIMDAPEMPGESGLLHDVFRILRKESPAQKSLASASLAYLLHRWMAVVQDQKHISAHQARVAQAIETMHNRPDGSCRVNTLAKSVGLSERRFRQVFETTTGQTPKHFYDGIRLDLGRQLLLDSPAKIEAVSERLGFSSPFHFSRSFRKRFGLPPSHIRRAITD
ncbi:MAG: helix-turn-helix domain-containing protein [bacterium]